MTMVLEITGIKTEGGVTKYKCIVGDDKLKQLERHKIANFNDVKNPYEEKTPDTDEKLKAVAKNTESVYNLIIKDRKNPGIKKHILRLNTAMYIQNSREIEVLYTNDDKQEHKKDFVEYNNKIHLQQIKKYKDFLLALLFVSLT